MTTESNPSALLATTSVLFLVFIFMIGLCAAGCGDDMRGPVPDAAVPDPDAYMCVEERICNRVPCAVCMSMNRLCPCEDCMTTVCP